MVYKNTLTTNQKDKKIPIIIERDGDVCYFDEMPFDPRIPSLSRTVDHLNNNEKDNRIENLGLCHFECNQRKKFNAEMQVIAKDKLERNMIYVSESLRVSERDNNAHTSNMTEGEVNALINRLVYQTLDEHLPDQNSKPISYSRILKSITYLVTRQSGGRGSEIAVRRSLDAHCSDYAPWGTETEGRNRTIWRRKTI